MHDIYWYILFYFLAGAFSGILSGLFGVGGGIILVPVFLYLFEWQYFPPHYTMQLAAGTSLAVMIFTTTRSLLSHMKYKVEFWDVFRRLLPSVIIGSIAGAVLAHFLHSTVIKIIFGIVLALISLEMLIDLKISRNWSLPGPIGMSTVGGIIGLKSGLLGIGGGSISIPFLTLCNVSMRKAVLVSVSIGITVSIIGAISYGITGSFNHLLPPWSLGYIYLPAWLPATVGSILFAPFGARLSHVLPVEILKRIFAIFLFIVAIHILWSALINPMWEF